MKNSYESNEVFAFLDSMPKGGLLHIHSGALMDIDWVLRNDKWGNNWDKNVGLTAALNNDYGFFVDNTIIQNEEDIYIKGTGKLFNAFKKGTYTPFSDAAKTIVAPYGLDANGVRNCANYNQQTNIYTDPVDGTQWLDLSAINAASKQPAYSEEVQKNIRRCLTMVGANDTQSVADYDIPKVWSVFELVNDRWSSLRDASIISGPPPVGTADVKFVVKLFAAGMRYLYDQKVQHIDIRLGFGPIKDFDKIVDAITDVTLKNLKIVELQENLATKTIAKIKDYIEAFNILTSELKKESAAKTTTNFKIRFILSTPRVTSTSQMSYLLSAAFMVRYGKSPLAGYDPSMTLAEDKKPKLLITNLAATPTNQSFKTAWFDASMNGETLKTLVTGYDMIAEEDRNKKTDVYKNQFLATNQLEINFGDVNGQVKIAEMNYYFHDGESNWHTNYNVVDAVMLGTKRIGHGFNIDMRPGVVAKAIRDNICLEICPISNQILQYTPDIRSHYANGLFRQGLPMTLSNDDPIMFGYNGLTYDFFAAAVSWNLSYKAIKRLAWSSIEYSTLNNTEKVAAKTQFATMFNTWIRKIADSYKITNANTSYLAYTNPVDLTTNPALAANTPPSLDEYKKVCC
jgi:hypothetical protein